MKSNVICDVQVEVAGGDKMQLHSRFPFGLPCLFPSFHNIRRYSVKATKQPKKSAPEEASVPPSTPTKQKSAELLPDLALLSVYYKNLQQQSLEELKTDLRIRGEKLSGRKAELVDRILKSQISGKNLLVLRKWLKQYGFESEGTREEVVDRILKIATETKNVNETVSENAVEGVDGISKTLLKNLKLEELREVCRRVGNPLTGNKDNLAVSVSERIKLIGTLNRPHVNILGIDNGIRNLSFSLLKVYLPSDIPDSPSNSIRDNLLDPASLSKSRHAYKCEIIDWDVLDTKINEGTWNPVNSAHLLSDSLNSILRYRGSENQIDVIHIEGAPVMSAFKSRITPKVLLRVGFTESMLVGMLLERCRDLGKSHVHLESTTAGSLQQYFQRYGFSDDPNDVFNVKDIDLEDDASDVIYSGEVDEEEIEFDPEIYEALKLNEESNLVQSDKHRHKLHRTKKKWAIAKVTQMVKDSSRLSVSGLAMRNFTKYRKKDDLCDSFLISLAWAEWWMESRRLAKIFNVN